MVRTTVVTIAAQAVVMKMPNATRGRHLDDNNIGMGPPALQFRPMSVFPNTYPYLCDPKIPIHIEGEKNVFFFLC